MVRRKLMLRQPASELEVKKDNKTDWSRSYLTILLHISEIVRKLHWFPALRHDRKPVNLFVDPRHLSVTKWTGAK